MWEGFVVKELFKSKTWWLLRTVRTLITHKGMNKKERPTVVIEANEMNTSNTAIYCGAIRVKLRKEELFITVNHQSIVNFNVVTR